MRRALRLLDAGRAPVAWLREAERSGARLHALERGAAWAPALAAVRPALREGPLLGGALDALSSPDPRPAPSSVADAPASPPAPYSRGGATSPSRRSATRAAPSSPNEPDHAAPRHRTPRERRAASAPGAARHRPRLAQLPRRADEGVLRRWSERAAPSAPRSGRTADPATAVAAAGARWSSASTPGAAVDAFAWDAFVRRASRAAASASPGTLPMLALPDRLRGWRHGGSAPGSPVAPALPPYDPRFADAGDAVAFDGSAGSARWIGTVARRAIRRFLRAAGVRTEGGPAAGWEVDVSAPQRPRMAGAGAPGSADAHRHEAGARGFDDSHRPRPADGAGAPGAAASRRLRPGDAAAGVDGSPALALEWGAPLDGPAAPADVLSRLADGRRARAAGRGSAGDATRRPPADAAASLLRQLRRGAGAAGEAEDGDAPASASAVPGEPHRGRRGLPIPTLVREPADRAGGEDGPSAARAVRTSPGVPRPSPHPLFAAGRAARERAAGAEPGGEDSRDRWPGWPAVLPWPRATRAGAVEAPATRPRAPRTNAPSAPARRAADASGGEGQETPSAAPGAEAEGAPRGPIPSAGELYRPAGPLPPPMTPGPFPPRAAAIGEAAPDRAAAEAARPPAPLAGGEDAAPWAGGGGAPPAGAPAAAPPLAPAPRRAAAGRAHARGRRRPRR
ncbi:MAG: hypothetical protein ACJ8J0_13100, partial [Longimicrobiaceae bacterium]